MTTLVKLGLILLLLQAVGVLAGNIVTQVSANWHTLFIESDGSLWGMGNNDAGELGDGTSRIDSIVNFTNRPEQIVDSGVVAISAGGSHTLFIKSDGSLWGMGGNYYGQLGDGTTNNVARPKRIVSNGVVAVAAGSGHSLFLKSDGSLWGMGENDLGQLGDGSLSSSPPYGITRPEQIVSNGVAAIAAGTGQSLFLKLDGSVWGMGEVLGYMSVHPAQIVASGITAIALGKHDFSVLLKADGSAWGMFNTSPYPVLGSGGVPVTNVIAIACGNENSLLLKSDGSLWIFDNGPVANAGVPPQQIVANGVVAIAAGAQHSLFIKSDGSLWATGLNDDGELGDGFWDLGTSVPEQIVPSPQPFLTGIKISSRTNLQFEGTCQFGGKYYLRATTNLALPLSRWTPVSTNSVQTRGINNFLRTLTNAVNSSGTQRFYILQSE